MKQKIENSHTFFERAKKVTPGGVHSPVRAFRGVGGVPRFIESAKGAYLFDVDENRYLDFCMSWGPLLFGHQDPEVQDSVISMMQKGWSFGATERYSLELAELITSSIPWAEKIRFTTSGTEAAMSAVRVARAVTGRKKILKFDGCYHGHADAFLVKAGSGLAEMSSPDSAGVPEEIASQTLVSPLDDENSFIQLCEQNANDIAAIAIEPLPANYGLLIQRKEFLQRVSERAKKIGALLIWDEVISGFRVSFGGMAEKMGITPDLVCYGKTIGGGFPVGAYAGKKEYMDYVAPLGSVYQAGTLSANPVSMIAGLTMLKKLKKLNPYQKLEETTEMVSRKIESTLGIKVQNFSSLFWITGNASHSTETVRSVSSLPKNQKENFAKLFHALLEEGVYLAPSGFEVSFMSTAHEKPELDFFFEALRRAKEKIE